MSDFGPVLLVPSVAEVVTEVDVLGELLADSPIITDVAERLARGETFVWSPMGGVVADALVYGSSEVHTVETAPWLECWAGREG